MEWSIYHGKRAVVLLSGGLDSVVSLAAAVREMDVRLAIFFNYGQRSLVCERSAVLAVVNYYSVPLKEIDIGWLGGIMPSGMRPRAEPEDKGNEPALTELASVWIPNRNGVFINIAAAFAESYSCEYVVTGFNQEEAESFPDNRGEYVTRMNRCLLLSTLSGVKVLSFTQSLDKSEIIGLGMELSAPLSVIWSCYQSGEVMCGECASCSKLKQAVSTLPREKQPKLEFAA